VAEEQDSESLQFTEGIISSRESSVDAIIHPAGKEPDRIDDLRAKLYILKDALRTKGFKGFVDCGYNAVMSMIGRKDLLPPEQKPEENEEEVPDIEGDIDKAIQSSHPCDSNIRILDIVNYMICPPVSGGMLRVLAPLEKIPKDSGITIDMVFGTWGAQYARSCEDYLNRIPVIGLSKGVVVPLYTKDLPGIPEDLPKDVWITVSKVLLDYAVTLVSKEKYDIIQIEHSQLSWMVPALRMASPSSKIVLDAHNAEYRVFETWLPHTTEKDRREIESNYQKMKAWESRVWGWYDAAFTVSPVEEDLLRAAGVEDVCLVPTGGGIDPAKYAPVPGIEKRYDILYIGSMNWFPNYHGLKWFLREVYPIIVSRRPGTDFHIVGNGTPDKELLRIVSKVKGVKFWGFQEDDVQFFHTSRVFVVPLWIGAGARVKIPTAWAAGIPIVSTVFGAEGLPAEDGRNMFLTDSPETFAEDVISLLNNQELSDRISQNALETLRGNYTTEICAEKLVKDYKEIAKH